MYIFRTLFILLNVLHLIKKSQKRECLLLENLREFSSIPISSDTTGVERTGVILKRKTQLIFADIKNLVNQFSWLKSLNL